ELVVDAGECTFSPTRDLLIGAEYSKQRIRESEGRVERVIGVVAEINAARDRARTARLQGVGIEVAAFDRMRPRQLCHCEVARFVVVLQDEVAEWLTPIERRVGDAVAPREVRSCLRALSVPDGGLVSEMLQDPIRHGARIDESRIRKEIRNAAKTGSDAVRTRVYRVAGDAPV